MAAVPSTCLVRIKKDQHWENYQSLKKHWSKKRGFNEVMFDGFITTTATLAELKDGTDQTIAFLGANDIVYVRSETDLEALDSNSIWIDYIDSEGNLFEDVETLLDAATSTDTEVPIGHEGVKDTVAAVDEYTVTLTAEGSAYQDYYKGKYMVVYSGNQEGTSSLITASTPTTPTVLTVEDSQEENLADDLISIQSHPHDDVYRIRQVRTETESPTDNFQCVCDKDKTNIYAVVPDGNSQSNHPRYTALSTDYRCFLGKIEVEAALQGVAKGDEAAFDYYVNLDYEIKITYTPKAWDTNEGAYLQTEDDQAACEISQTFAFTDKFEWEPCIELEPATDVIIYIRKINDADHSKIRVSYSMLEALIV